MKLYRIYTENKDRDFIKRTCDNVFTGYTMYEASGVWNHTAESSIIIEYVGEEHEYGLVKATAKIIKEGNKQDAVLVMSSDIESEVI